MSQFFYLKTRPDLIDFMGLHRWCSFKTYIKALHQKRDNHVQSFEQHKFLQDESGNDLVDFIGRFENLEADFAQAVDAIGIGDRTLAHVRKSKRRKHYKKHYNAFTMQAVNELYERDILRFRYAF